MTNFERSQQIETISQELLKILDASGPLAGNDLLKRYLEHHDEVGRASAELALSMLINKDAVDTDSEMRLQAA